MRPQPALALAIDSGSVTNGGTATAVNIDTSPPGKPRARHLSLAIAVSAPGAATNKPTVLKLQHSDTTDATNFADISGLVGGTDFSIPNMSTSVTSLYAFNVNLQGRKRYIRAQISPQTTQTIWGLANLHWLDESPNTAAKANVATLAEA